MADPLPATGEDAPPVVVSGVSKTFGTTRVVDGVDLVVRPGRIHALLGGNGSGKSTVLKMLAGVVAPDPGGTISLFGTEYAAEHHRAALAERHGLRFVHQDLALVDDLSVAENIALGTAYPTRGALGIRWRRLRQDAAAALRRVGLAVDVDTRVRALRPSDRTLVAIARALGARTGETATVLVLDEPTASLPHAEVTRLLAAMREFRAAGHSIIFVSHHLPEVQEVADDVTVLRDGRVVGSGEVRDFDTERILALMAGHAHEVATRSVAAVAADAPAALVLRGFGAGPVADLDLSVRRGEIVGFAGLIGSGRSSILRGVFGDLPHEGTIVLDGAPAPIRSTADAVAAGVVFIPEDRRGEAAFLDRPVWENVSAAVLSTYRRMLRVDRRRERSDAGAVADAFRVRSPSLDAPLDALSGGNQQKVVLARWLRSDPRVILLDEPTQGVDVISRDEIHAIVRDRAAKGAAVLVVSSDLEELELLCHRVVVLQAGRAVEILSGDALTVAGMTRLTQTEVQEGARP